MMEEDSSSDSGYFDQQQEHNNQQKDNLNSQQEQFDPYYQLEMQDMYEDMNEDKNERIKLQKCTQHQQYSCHFIHIKEKQKGFRLCIKCIREGHIPFEEVLSLDELLQSDSDSILESYPPLQSTKIAEEILKISKRQESFSKQIDVYFSTLKKQVMKQIEIAQLKAKKQISKLEENRQCLEQKYKEIANIEEIQDIILQEQGNEDELLKSIISKKITQSEANSKSLKNLIHQFIEMKEIFSSQQPLLKQQQVISSLSEIDFFQEKKTLSILQRVNSALSTEFNQQKNSSILQGYYDIDLNDHYIITFLLSFKKIRRIQCEQRNHYNELINEIESCNDNFMIGLIPDHFKNTNSIEQYNLYYSKKNQSNFKEVKQQRETQKVTSMNQIQVQINLKQQIFAVLDNQQNRKEVFSFKNFKNIIPSVEYRFGFQYDSSNYLFKLEEVERQTL